jgi:thiamine pyrophosphate-dependent acetolactate synthase large subunit-like protein
MEDIIAITLIFGTPIVGIISWTVIKGLQIITGRGKYSISNKDILHLKAENEEMKQRLENLEVIVTNADPTLMENYVRLQQQAKQAQLNQNQYNSYGYSQKRNQEIPLEENFKSVMNKMLSKVDSMLDDKKNTQRRY